MPNTSRCGCYGKMALTRKVYRVNGEVGTAVFKSSGEVTTYQAIRVNGGVQVTNSEQGGTNSQEETVAIYK